MLPESASLSPSNKIVKLYVVHFQVPFIEMYGENYVLMLKLHGYMQPTYQMDCVPDNVGMKK